MNAPASIEEFFEMEYFSRNNVVINGVRVRRIRDLEARAVKVPQDPDNGAAHAEAMAEGRRFYDARDAMTVSLRQFLRLDGKDRIYNTDEAVFIKQEKKVASSVGDVVEYVPDFNQLKAVADLLNQLR